MQKAFAHSAMKIVLAPMSIALKARRMTGRVI
jgi:hypothetical protein